MLFGEDGLLFLFGVFCEFVFEVIVLSEGELQGEFDGFGYCGEDEEQFDVYFGVSVVVGDDGCGDQECIGV